MPAEGTGRCLCGAMRFRWRAAPFWAGHCHCESCRRATSAPGVRRSFCGSCGAQMAFAADRYPGEIHFYAATMDRPEDYRPAFHVHVGERLGFIHLADGLPQYEGSGP